jgi:type VI secretion system secreted protein VgrG
MADNLSQANRLMSLATQAGADVLCIERATITERISKPFSMQFDMLAEKSKAGSVNAKTLLGSSATLTVELPRNKKRYFNGIISRLAETGVDDRFAYYRAEVVPQLWLLTMRTNCKIFQDKTVPDVLKEVLQGFDVSWNLQGQFAKLDYCVQYRETDFNFMSRLMEEEGIYYYFEHADGKHTLVIANTAQSQKPCPNLEKARLVEAGMGEWEDTVTSLEHRRSVVPGKATLRDYHFEMPHKNLQESSKGAVSVASNDKLEVYDYPGGYAYRINKPDDHGRLSELEKKGEETAKWRIEEQNSGYLQISGASTCRAFTTGHFFSLMGAGGSAYNIPETDGKYTLSSIKHSFQQSPDYISGASVNQPYRNTFTCIPHDAKFRPARTTSKPVIHGIQTAAVVGLKGEEIDCDKYGRVKVQFHWDREGKKDENSSCWVRVGSPLAGNQWGMIHIPRIGQEVIVAFLEGDPDQPLIVGSVYNADNMPPFDLPDNKTQSGINTLSAKKGQPRKNYNGICFEDKKDHEKFDVQAERDFQQVVKNNAKIIVGKETKDAGDQEIEIYNNQSLKVGTAGCKEGSQTLNVYKDRTATLEMGNDALTIKMGNQTTKLDLGASSTEAMQSIELKVGQNSIKIDQTGVTISGLMIQINGQAMTQVKGTMTQIQGAGMLQLSGGIMMLG